MEMLHDTEIRPKYRVILDKAQFEQKGDYVPRKKVTEDKVALIKTKTDQDRLLSWNEEEEGEGLKIVIILNMFGPEDVEVRSGLMNRVGNIGKRLKKILKRIYVKILLKNVKLN